MALPIAVLLIAVLAPALHVTSAQAADLRPTSVTCRGFSTSEVRYTVKRSRGVSCPRARRVMRQFFTGRKRVHHIDGMMDNAHTYYTLPGLPGWRCGTGAGDGDAGSAVCSRRRSGVNVYGYGNLR